MKINNILCLFAQNFLGIIQSKKINNDNPTNTAREFKFKIANPTMNNNTSKKIFLYFKSKLFINILKYIKAINNASAIELGL
jgi:hypothetical protein